MRNTVQVARGFGELQRDSETSERWRDAYKWLSGERQGTVGEVTSRMEAHAVRLSLIYALLDGSQTIQAKHLQAALAVCEYALRSAEYCFGGLSAYATAILHALKERSPAEMTRTEITEGVFQKHIKGNQLETALGELQTADLARCRKEQTTGAPRELWSAN